MQHHTALPQFILTVQSSIKINSASTLPTKRSLYHKDRLQKPSLYYSASYHYGIHMQQNCTFQVLCAFMLCSHTQKNTGRPPAYLPKAGTPE